MERTAFVCVQHRKYRFVHDELTAKLKQAEERQQDAAQNLAAVAAAVSGNNLKVELVKDVFINASTSSDKIILWLGVRS